MVITKCPLFCYVTITSLLSDWIKRCVIWSILLQSDSNPETFFNACKQFLATQWRLRNNNYIMKINQPYLGIYLVMILVFAVFEDSTTYHLIFYSFIGWVLPIIFISISGKFSLQWSVFRAYDHIMNTIKAYQLYRNASPDTVCWSSNGLDSS